MSLKEEDDLPPTVGAGGKIELIIPEEFFFPVGGDVGVDFGGDDVFFPSISI